MSFKPPLYALGYSWPHDSKCGSLLPSSNAGSFQLKRLMELIFGYFPLSLERVSHGFPLAVCQWTMICNKSPLSRQERDRPWRHCMREVDGLSALEKWCWGLFYHVVCPVGTSQFLQMHASKLLTTICCFFFLLRTIWCCYCSLEMSNDQVSIQQANA